MDIYFILCVHADGPLSCLIWASIREVMLAITLTILGATPKSLLSLGNAPTQIAISLSSHLRLGSF